MLCHIGLKVTVQQDGSGQNWAYSIGRHKRERRVDFLKNPPVPHPVRAFKVKAPFHTGIGNYRAPNLPITQ
jgi:hypothetical protein